MNYRLYLLDEEGTIDAAENFAVPDGADDAEAVAIAVNVYEAVSDVMRGYEVWQGRRRVAVFHPLPVQRPDPAQWTEARQLRVIDLEERLAASFECIRTSRQLLETVDKLMDREDRPPALARLTDGGA